VELVQDRVQWRVEAPGSVPRETVGLTVPMLTTNTF
jgi:hypothetical protein